MHLCTRLSTLRFSLDARLEFVGYQHQIVVPSYRLISEDFQTFRDQLAPYMLFLEARPTLVISWLLHTVAPMRSNPMGTDQPVKTDHRLSIDTHSR